jgi:hypothetical protein
MSGVITQKLALKKFRTQINGKFNDISSGGESK